MKICFVLPQFSRKPIGGNKIVFEYANRLQEKGDVVSILFLNKEALKKYKLPEKLRCLFSNILTQIEPRWFKLHTGVSKFSGLEKNLKSKLKNTDACFATTAITFGPVQELFPESQGYYLIQGYETWDLLKEELHKTYAAGYINIVIADWLRDIVDKHTEKPSFLLRNPIDTQIYRMKIPNEQRAKHSIAFLYHAMPHKGLKYTLEAMRRLKERYPDIKAHAFGTMPKPADFPTWIHYTCNASQQQTVDIYNAAQVYICATVEEGFGLTGLEAMACGTALVSTAHRGVLEYAKNGENAFLSPVCDVDALVENVSRLFENEKERLRIVSRGIEQAKKCLGEKRLHSLTLFYVKDSRWRKHAYKES